MAMDDEPQPHVSSSLMSTSFRAELHIFRESESGRIDESRIGCRVEANDEKVGSYYRAHGTPDGHPGFTAWARSEHSALLALFAQWMGVEQDLQDALTDVEREAWHKEGRTCFRTALAAVFDKIDSKHAHEVSDSDDDVDRLWRDGCRDFGLPRNGCTILQYSGKRQFHIDAWCSRAVCACSDPIVQAIALRLGGWAKGSRKLTPIRHPAQVRKWRRRL